MREREKAELLLRYSLLSLEDAILEPFSLEFTLKYLKAKGETAFFVASNPIIVSISLELSGVVLHYALFDLCFLCAVSFLSREMEDDLSLLRFPFFFLLRR